MNKEYQMKRILPPLIVFLFIFSTLVGAQPNYLIRVDQIDQPTIDKLKSIGTDVYAKLADFWLAGANQKDLELLKREGVSFRILDKEAEVGEFYLIWSKPSEKIIPQLSKIRAEYRVLTADQDVALIKGAPERIEKLATLGYNLRKIQKAPLPFESRTYIPSYLESLLAGYDPLIAEIVNKVDQEKLLTWIDDLSGEDTVTVGGVEDLIKTRYTYTAGVYKAAHWLKERFAEMGVSVEFDTFRTPGSGTYLMDVVCGSDDQKAWAVNYWGGILKTTDGGEEWSLVGGTGNLYLWDICMASDGALWAVGDYVVVRSLDGGEIWEDKSKPEFVEMWFRGSYFEDANCGWVVGGGGKVLFTTDGGASWTQQEQVVYSTLYGVDFVDSAYGWAVSEFGTILHTTDRGTNWNAQSSGTSSPLRGIDFVDSLNGWAVGTGGTAVFTTDGGLNWIKKNLPTSTILFSINFVDSLHGWMVGFDGSMFYTSDLGKTWISQPSNTHRLCGVAFADTLTGWAVGYYEIIKTTDGGQSWFTQWENTIKHLNVVATIEGLSYPKREFLITGHYDDVSQNPYNWAPGADDNASGTVSLLASASILKDYSLANTVKLVAFSGEEQGLLGSAAYAQEAYQRGDTILGVLNFDMIAYDSNGDDIMEVHCGSPSENRALANLLINSIYNYGLDLIPQKITSNPGRGSDHASFWDYNFPAIFGIEDLQDFNRFYHTTGDRVSAFDTSYYVDFTKAAVASISTLGDPVLIGDADGDGKIDLADAVYIANYVLKGGPTPEPLLTADANGDGNVDLSDVLYLANYLYKSGPVPRSR